MNIAICDDEIGALDEIGGLIKEYAAQKNYDIHIKNFTSVNTLLRSAEHFDLYMLDYKMGEKDIDGMQLAVKLRERKIYSEIVFITCYHEIIYERPMLFQIKPMAFLRKPIRQEDIQFVIDSLHTVAYSDQCILLKRNGFAETIRVQDILYLEAFQRGTRLHLRGEERVYAYPISYFSDILPQNVFVQTHRSYIVNMYCVKKYNAGRIVLQDGNDIPLSKYVSKEFQEKYRVFLFGRPLCGS